MDDPVIHVPDFDECEVCGLLKENAPMPFTKMEVGDGDGHWHWVGVCSEDCEQQVALRHKQVSEVIRPDEYRSRPHYRLLHDGE